MTREERSNYRHRTTLINAIKRRLDKDERAGVAEHGADAGWAGFTYYRDTCRFYARHKAAIWDLLAEDAEAFGEGENIWAFIASFKRSGVGDVDQAENLLVWYALEKVCQDEQDEREAAREAKRSRRSEVAA